MDLDATGLLQEPAGRAAIPTRAERRRKARPAPFRVGMPWIVALATLVLRLVTAAAGPTDWDSAQYAAAGGAGLTAVAGRDLGGWWVGLAAGGLVAASPFAWFSGSIVATYSFDLVACPLLVILAWRDRPGSSHGIGAVAVVGVLAGFRQSIVQAFLVLALVAVAGSTRRW